MLRRITRSRMFQDVVNTAIVLAASALLLFAAGTLAAQWMVRQWTMSAQIGGTVAGLYLAVALPFAAGIALPRLVRILRSVRAR